MSSNIRERIVALYGEKTLRKSALNIRGGAGVFERVLSGKGYRTALEIGTYKGCATAEIAQYVDRVVTIDLRYGKLEQNGDTFDRRAFWALLGVLNVSLYLVDDDEEKRRIVDALDFDFAFIDGGHDAVSVRRDFEMTRRCGRVLFHDYDYSGAPEKDAVYDFVNSLPKDEVEAMDIFALWTASGREE